MSALPYSAQKSVTGEKGSIALRGTAAQPPVGKYDQTATIARPTFSLISTSVTVTNPTRTYGSSG